MRVAQEGTGVPIYIPLRWIFLYHSSYHCTEWVRKQWNQKTKQNKGNCQSAQPYRFGSDETCTGSGSRVWMGKGAYARFIRKKEKKNYMLELPEIILVFLSLLFEIVAGHFGCIFRYFGSWFRNGVSGINLQFVHL